MGFKRKFDPTHGQQKDLGIYPLRTAAAEDIAG